MFGRYEIVKEILGSPNLKMSEKMDTVIKALERSLNLD